VEKEWKINRKGMKKEWKKDCTHGKKYFIEVNGLKLQICVQISVILNNFLQEVKIKFLSRNLYTSYSQSCSFNKLV